MHFSNKALSFIQEAIQSHKASLLIQRDATDCSDDDYADLLNDIAFLDSIQSDISSEITRRNTITSED